MPPKIYWDDTSFIPIPILDNIYENPHKQLVKRHDGESPMIFVAILVGLVVFGLLVWFSYYITFRGDNDPPYDPNAPPDPRYLSDNDETAFKANNGHPGGRPSSIICACELPTRMPDDTPRLPVEHNIYRPPRINVLEIHGTSVSGIPTAQPTRGLEYRPSWSEADRVAKAEVHVRRQPQIPEMDGVPVGGYKDQNQPETSVADGEVLAGNYTHQRQGVSEVGGASLPIAPAEPIRVPVPAHQPDTPQADGRANIRGLPGPSNQLPHKLDSARGGSYRWELVYYPPDAAISSENNQ